MLSKREAGTATNLRENASQDNCFAFKRPCSAPFSPGRGMTNTLRLETALDDAPVAATIDEEDVDEDDVAEEDVPSCTLSVVLSTFFFLGLTSLAQCSLFIT